MSRSRSKYDEDFAVDTIDDFTELDDKNEVDAAPVAAAAAPTPAAAPAAAVPVAAPAPPVPSTMMCELCDCEFATIKCAMCESAGMGEGFCVDCSHQLHASAKGKLHKLTDLNGNTIQTEKQVEDKKNEPANTTAATTTNAAADATQITAPPPTTTPDTAAAAPIPAPPAAAVTPAPDTTPTTHVDTKPEPTVTSPVIAAPKSSAFDLADDDSYSDEEDDLVGDIGASAPIDGDTNSTSTATTVSERFDELKRARQSDPSRSPSPFIASTSAAASVPPASSAASKSTLPPEQDLCGSCLTCTVTTFCHDCARDYCNSCDAAVHITRELKRHVREPVSNTVNMHAAASSPPPSQPTPATATPHRDSVDNVSSLSVVGSPNFQSSSSATRHLYDASPAAGSPISGLSTRNSAAPTTPTNITTERAKMEDIAKDGQQEETMDRTEQATTHSQPTQPPKETQQPVAASAAATQPADDDDDDDYDFSDDATASSVALDANKSTPPAAVSSTPPSSIADPTTTATAATPIAAPSQPSPPSQPATPPSPVQTRPPLITRAPTITMATLPRQTTKKPTVGDDVEEEEEDYEEDEEDDEEVDDDEEDDYGDSGFDTASPTAAGASTQPPATPPAAASPSPAASPKPAPSPSAAANTNNNANTSVTKKSESSTTNKAAGTSAAPSKSVKSKHHKSLSQSSTKSLSNKKTKSKSDSNKKSSKSKSKSSSSSSSPNRSSSTAVAAAADPDDDPLDDAAGDGEDAFHNRTMLEGCLSALVQDPLDPTAQVMGPILEGMILPTTVVCRAGRPTAAYYTDAAGFVRYHAWTAPKSDKESRSSSRHTSPVRVSSGSSSCVSVATSMSISSKLVDSLASTIMTGPPGNGASSTSSKTNPAYIDMSDVLRQFTPNLKTTQTTFLKKNKQNQNNAHDGKNGTTTTKGSKYNTTTTTPSGDGDDDYSADDDGAVVDSTVPNKSQFTSASSAARANRGYINIEEWKKEERALMMARQKAAKQAEDEELKRQAEIDRQAAIEQEKLYVGIIIFTRGCTSASESSTLPSPVAVTLGQVRKLFRAVVLSSRDLPSHPTPFRLGQFDFILQKLEFPSTPQMESFRVVYDEATSLTQVQVHKCLNRWTEVASVQTQPPSQPAGAPSAAGSPPHAATTGVVHRNLSSTGFKHVETCYTYKGPVSCGTYTQEFGPIRYDDTHRRFKKVLLALIRRIQEIGLGRTTLLQGHFQRGSIATINTTATTTKHNKDQIDWLTPVSSTAGEVRRNPWYFLFVDSIALSSSHARNTNGSLVVDGSTSQTISVPESGNMLDLASHVSQLSDEPKLLLTKDATTGEVLLPGMHAYTPLVLNVSATVDRSTCVKCKTRILDSSQINMVMLKALLLKWVPNHLFEYPEELFASVLGVDENPEQANWHRMTVVSCTQCLDEIRALKTIPNRTQLAPWLSSLPVTSSQVPSPRLESPQVRSGTQAIGASVTIPLKERAGGHRPTATASGLPSLLPYLARAPALHTAGHGHAAELIPSVAFIPRKHNSLLEIQGVIGAQGGLALDPIVEFEGNRGGLKQSTRDLQHQHARTNIHAAAASRPSTLSSSASVPNLARSHRDGTRVDKTFGGLTHLTPNVNQRGVFNLESTYMDQTHLNPHEHPTHMLIPTSQVSPAKKPSHTATSMITSPTSPLKEKLLLPNHSRLASKLARSSSIPAMPVTSIVASKSSIAGGGGTAPALPHMPLAPTIILSPVKSHGPTAAGSTNRSMAATKAWAGGDEKTSTSGSTRFPTIATKSKATPNRSHTNSKPTSAKKVGAGATLQPIATAGRSAATSSKAAPAPVDDDEDADYAVSDEFIAEDAPTDSGPVYSTNAANAAPRAWWDAEVQEWSYAPPPTHYTPIFYDPDVEYQQQSNQPQSTFSASPYDESVIEDEIESSVVVPPAAPPAVQTVDEIDEIDDEYEEDF